MAGYIGYSYKLSHTVKQILYYSVCTVLHCKHEKLCSSTDSEKNKQIQCIYLWQHSWCPFRSGTNPRRTQRSGCKASWSTAITSLYFLISPFKFFSKTFTLAGHSVPFSKPCFTPFLRWKRWFAKDSHVSYDLTVEMANMFKEGVPMGWNGFHYHLQALWTWHGTNWGWLVAIWSYWHMT